MVDQTTHPSPQELSAYSLGQLPPEAAASVENHIGECGPCCETMLGLSADDTFVGLLQEAGQLPTSAAPGDQTVDHTSGSTGTTAAPQAPASLKEHPRYEIVGLIGKGGMGDVYRARHRMMDRTVALKIIKRELTRKPEAVNRFHREVKAAAQLSHPNIVTAYDAEQAGDLHFMVMEYVDGVDLSQMVNDRGALPIAQACEYIRQAALGLQQAHEQGMVHRDIKPHNLMVTAGGTVKILDFGLASLAPQTSFEADAENTRGDLTAVGAIMGTPDFISPEQAGDARSADIRSDIYSLGSTLYFLLAGRPPFAEGSVTQKLDSHAQAEPQPLASLRDDVPPELAAVISKMMAKNPDERYLTPSEVADALESFLRTWQSNELESTGHIPSHGGSGSGSDGQKPVAEDMRPDWRSVATEWLIPLAFVPIALLMWELFFTDFSGEAADIRFWFYIGTALCLSTIGGALSAAQRFKSEMRQFERGDRRAFRLKPSETLLMVGILVLSVSLFFAKSSTETVADKLAKYQPSVQHIDYPPANTARVLLHTVEGEALDGRPAAICDIDDCRIALLGQDISKTNNYTESLYPTVSGKTESSKRAIDRDKKVIFSSKYADGKAKCQFHDFKFQMTDREISFGKVSHVWKDPSSPGLLILVDQATGKITTQSMKPRSERVYLEGAVKLGSAEVSKALPDEVQVQRILDRMKNAYAECDTYRDSGVIKTVILENADSPQITLEHSLSTVFERPNRFRFEIKDEDDQTVLISVNGQEVRTWWDVEPRIQKPESLDLAMAQAIGFSGAGVDRIPALLMPQKLDGGIDLDLIDPKQIEDGKLQNVECFRLEFNFREERIILWIDKQSHLVRKIDEWIQADGTRIERTTTYDPTIDGKITGEMLEFDPADPRVEHTDPTSDHQKIQGTWQVTHYAENGRVEPLEFALQKKLAFAENLLTFTMEEGREEVSSFKLDASAKPKSIELTNGDQVILGIYELRDDQLRICLTQGRKGARPITFDSKPDTTSNILIVAKRPQGFTASPNLATMLDGTGLTEGEFRMNLNAAISRAAGIPKAQWQEMARNGLARTDSIAGMPLSLLLLTTDNARVFDNHFSLTGHPSITKIEQAISPSMPDGYVSAIQPGYITATTIDIDPDTKLLQGSVSFACPNFYEGNVDFSMTMAEGRMDVVEFALPKAGIRLVRNAEGEWTVAAEDSNAHPRPTLADLHEDWMVVLAHQGGKAEVAPLSVLSVNGKRYSLMLRKPNGLVYDQRYGTIEIDSSKKPYTIDFSDIENRADDLAGIFEIVGGKLRLCLVQRSDAEGDLKRPADFESPKDTDIQLWECQPAFAVTLAKTVQTEAESRATLYKAISRAAGIPNAQWEEFATDPRASTEGIEGEPLSLLLLGLNPPRESKENPDVLQDFRLLKLGVPKPTELHKAMAPSQSHGYVSVIQPDYVKDAKVDIDPETGDLRGGVEFAAPDLYAGKVTFVMAVARGRIQITEFALPNYGITIGMDDQGHWVRKNAASPPHESR